MSRIEERMVKNGIPMPAFRKAMREAAELMIADGDGTTAGIHDVGVFYAQLLQERYVIRNNIVYEIAERTVLKLRPPKGDVTELAESDDVRMGCFHVYTADLEYQFTSASRAAQFVLQLPTGRQGESWKLYRQTVDGKPSYVFGLASLGETTLAGVVDPLFGTGDEWTAARMEHSCDAWQSAVDANGFSVSSPMVSAETDGLIVHGIGDPVEGKQALAHWRSRALDFA